MRAPKSKTFCLLMGRNMCHSPSLTLENLHGQLHYPHLIATQLSDCHAVILGITGIIGITARAGITIIPDPS